MRDHERSGVLMAAGMLALFGVLALAAPGHVYGQFVVSDSKVGYIDSAIPGNTVRFRFDDAAGGNFADRVEFQYGRYGGPGAPLTEKGIQDYQELSAYLEVLLLERLSAFVDVPVRWINPVVNENAGGLYDINAGLKFALFQTDSTVLSAQLRAYAPSGEASRSLGTAHASLEPSGLVYHQFSERLSVEGELRLWIPIDASTTNNGREFGGNVLRYGAAVGYELCETPAFKITPITELVGWQVLGGLKTFAGTPISADGDAIVNLKTGLRIAPCNRGSAAVPSSLFVGYGFGLTDERWYDQILRLEMRWSL